MVGTGRERRAGRREGGKSRERLRDAYRFSPVVVSLSFSLARDFHSTFLSPLGFREIFLCTSTRILSAAQRLRPHAIFIHARRCGVSREMGE